jgi:hypothetical protein
MREDHRLGEGKTEDLWQSGSLVDKVTPDRRPKASTVQSSSRKAPRLASKRAVGIGGRRKRLVGSTSTNPSKGHDRDPAFGLDGRDGARVRSRCGRGQGWLRNPPSPGESSSRFFASPVFYGNQLILMIRCLCSNACCFGCMPVLSRMLFLVNADLLLWKSAMAFIRPID